jgi:hypothetical protein
MTTISCDKCGFTTNETSIPWCPNCEEPIDIKPETINEGEYNGYKYSIIRNPFFFPKRTIEDCMSESLTLMCPHGDGTWTEIKANDKTK